MPAMQPEVAQRLLALNATFYQAQAQSFAETRRRPQPGVAAVLKSIDPSASLLDIGCGHGVVAHQLALQGHAGGYTGIDASPHLLELARQAVHQPGFAFCTADLAQPSWSDGLAPAFSMILAFAVLHHLPGEALRRRVVSDLSRLLDEAGKVEVSVWNFLDLDRLRRRVIPWDRLGLAASDVDPGDYLLDWRQGGSGLRYVHHFTPAELAALAESAGLTTSAERYSDGENGRLGLYQSWAKPG
jgi:tRNA (uracil-5-)-methyltransferase TRM9